MSIYKNGKLVAGGRQTTPLLSFMWADHILDDISWLRADTFSWQSGAVYTAVYQHLADDITGKTLQSEIVGGVTVQFYLADDGHKICPASEESNVASIFSATGVAWYYIIDATNQRFKLPRTKFGFTGIRTGVGKFVEAGLPNITGITNSNRSTHGYSDGGAFYDTEITHTWYGDNIHTNVNNLGFDASLSNSIYGNSTTVQPPATEMYLYFYVGSFTQTALENTAGVTTEVLNDKADLDFGNTTMIDYVVEKQDPTSSNNYTWYRKYKSGWVEQGGTCAANYNGEAVTFPVTMNDGNYQFQLSVGQGQLTGTVGSVAYNRTTTGMTVYTNYSTGTPDYICWQVSGMAAN